MRHLVASIAACLMYVGSVNAADFVLESGVDGFQVGQPVPAELLQKLGPRLDATGSEELRLASAEEYPDNNSLIDNVGPVESTVWLREFIRGREVRQGWVSISLNTRTNEVTLLEANFLPDRGLSHELRLTAAQAMAKAKPQLRTKVGPVAFDDTPAQLVYDFERSGEFGGRDGHLVWVFEAKRPYPEEPLQVTVNSTNGAVTRIRNRVIGCFGRPPGEWMDLALPTLALPHPASAAAAALPASRP